MESHASLLGCYGDGEFDSPTRSTIPLLEFWRCPNERMRELSDPLGMVAPRELRLDFEHTVHPPRGVGPPSQTDVMAICPDGAIAIEAKWTESRYEEVGSWLGTSKNRTEVLRGWRDLLERHAGAGVREADLRRIPYQMVHRAASACHVEKVARRWLVYLVFDLTVEKRSEYLEDLDRLRVALGPSCSLGIALVEGTIEESTLLAGLRARWADGERGLHVPVLRGLRAGTFMTARLGRVHCVAAGIR